MTTKATNVRQTKEEREAIRAEKQKLPAFTNIKTRINSKDELVITVPAKEFRTSKLVQGDNLANAVEKYGTTSRGNVSFGATHDYIFVEHDEFELLFNLSVISRIKNAQAIVDDRVASEKLAKMNANKASESAPSMDMAEYQEFLEFKKWKAMMNQGK